MGAKEAPGWEDTPKPGVRFRLGLKRRQKLAKREQWSGRGRRGGRRLSKRKF